MIFFFFIKFCSKKIRARLAIFSPLIFGDGVEKMEVDEPDEEIVGAFPSLSFVEG